MHGAKRARGRGSAATGVSGQRPRPRSRAQAHQASWWSSTQGLARRRPGRARSPARSRRCVRTFTVPSRPMTIGAAVDRPGGNTGGPAGAGRDRSGRLGQLARRGRLQGRGCGREGVPRHVGSWETWWRVPGVGGGQGDIDCRRAGRGKLRRTGRPRGIRRSGLLGGPGRHCLDRRRNPRSRPERRAMTDTSDAAIAVEVRRRRRHRHAEPAGRPNAFRRCVIAPAEPGVLEDLGPILRSSAVVLSAEGGRELFPAGCRSSDGLQRMAELFRGENLADARRSGRLMHVPERPAEADRMLWSRARRSARDRPRRLACDIANRGVTGRSSPCRVCG